MADVKQRRLLSSDGLTGWSCSVPRLTDGGLLVMTGHVVPLDAVSVEIVEDGEAGLEREIYLLTN